MEEHVDTPAQSTSSCFIGLTFYDANASFPNLFNWVNPTHPSCSHCIGVAFYKFALLQCIKAKFAEPLALGDVFQ